MNTFSKLSKSRLRGVAIVTVGLAMSGITAVMAWVPGFGEVKGRVAPPDRHEMPAEAMTGSAARCLGCGVIESLHEIRGDESEASASGTAAPGAHDAAKHLSKRYEVTVRFKDGASRRFVDAGRSAWRLGERVIFIEGSRGSND